ncbi:hypothetical protein BKA24_001763 [Microbacterium marinum]|uniref:Uncharacterized protein n=1 Tax=Microbacterium marinum TaxID=421115 RepID=A0A7W7BSU7_9MICO|nr:hypothetical protein [Microbacterium marinum]MBB4667054.1 hypothetical protein [Microbacterium marinum]
MTAATLAAAVATLADAFDAYTLHDVGPALSCHEADALADVFTAAGLEDAAERVRDFHALGDSEEEGDDPDHVERAQTARERQGLAA